MTEQTVFAKDEEFSAQAYLARCSLSYIFLSVLDILHWMVHICYAYVCYHFLTSITVDHQVLTYIVLLLLDHHLLTYIVL